MAKSKKAQHRAFLLLSILLLTHQNSTAQRHRPSLRGDSESSPRYRQRQQQQQQQQPSAQPTHNPTSPRPNYHSSNDREEYKAEGSDDGDGDGANVTTASKRDNSGSSRGSRHSGSSSSRNNAISVRRSVRSSSIISNTEDCPNFGQLFQLELQMYRNSCETSWLLELEEPVAITIADNTDGNNNDNNNNDDKTTTTTTTTTSYNNNDKKTYHVSYVDGYNLDYDTHTHGASNINFNFASPSFTFSSSFSRSICLREGKYIFTIYDTFGDGILAPGYYMLALDGVVLAGSSNFGYEEMTKFTVVNDKSIEDYSSLDDDDYDDDDDALVGDDYDIDDTFSSWVPDRLSGVIDLSLVSSTSATHDNNTNEEEAYRDPSENNYWPPNDDLPTPYETTTWMELFKDDFINGLGIFDHASPTMNGQNYVTYYPFVKERRGVIRLQNEMYHTENDDGSINILGVSSSVCSDGIAIPQDVVVVKFVFSYYANSMEALDGFCVDYSIDNDGDDDHGGRSSSSTSSSSPTTTRAWHSKKCWHAMEDFDNGIWYDDIDVTFHLRNDHDVEDGMVVDRLRIRFRCKANSLHDDMLIDRVQLLGLVG